MKAIGYVRVSTQGQVDDGVSLDAQEAKIKAWADFNGYDEVIIHRDEGISGSRADNRDGLQGALDMIDEGDALVVASLSRLARSTRDTLDISDQLQKKDADLVSLSEKIDTTTAAGKMVFRMLAVLNEFERDQISERTRAALQFKKDKREWCGRIPYGFKVVDGKLAENPDQIKTIQKAKRMRRAGKSFRDISGALGLSLGYVHKALNVNLRSVKVAYRNG